MTTWHRLLNFLETKDLREVDNYVIKVLNSTEITRDNFTLSAPSTQIERIIRGNNEIQRKLKTARSKEESFKNVEEKTNRSSSRRLMGKVQ